MRDQESNSELTSIAPSNSVDSAGKERRAIIKGAVGALPLLLTLQSGAALARSSNLITATAPENARDRDGRTLCLDRRSVRTADGAHGVYDMGETGGRGARVTAISRRKYYTYSQGRGIQKVSEAEMCERGGSYYYKRRWGFRRVNVERGMLVSATALSSFADKINIIDI